MSELPTTVNATLPHHEVSVDYKVMHNEIMPQNNDSLDGGAPAAAELTIVLEYPRNT